MESYCKSLALEIENVGKKHGDGHIVDSIFLGGGTPSLIDEDMMAGVLQGVMDNFNVAENLECTIESNPKTLTKDKLEAYRRMGINRISMGVQSLDDELLRFMGRIHSSEDFAENYKLARACGFDNINVDLMFAIPGQTMETWLSTVNRIIEMEPDHISFYGLQLEEGTPFHKEFLKGELELVTDELDREMYHKALKLFKEAGYNHYEISNCAKPGRESKHNLKYWSMEDYLGLGLGAHSYVEGIRSSNQTSLASYINAANIKVDSHENTREDEMAEYIFTGMRRTRGIDLKDFERRFQTPIEEAYSASWPSIKRYMDQGYLIRRDSALSFTEKGIDISNKILAEFI